MHILTLVCVVLSMTGCSVDKYLQPGQKVLYENKVNVSMADSSAVPSEVTDALSGAKQYFYQKPNRRILWTPFLMRIYCLSNPDKDNWWNNFLRSNGEPPVVYDRAAAQRTASQLATLMKTKGCFNSSVTTDTVHRNGSSLTVNYNVRATRRRIIDDLEFRCRQQDINDLLQQWKGDSYLKVGDYYDQQKMTDEQSRLAANLKNEGYYTASTDVIRFLVDTTYDSRSLSITVVVRLPLSQAGDTARSALQKYHIDNIYIYPNVSTAFDPSRQHYDTLVYPYKSRHSNTDFYYIYDKKITPSPKTISRSMFLFNGMTYRPRFVTSTTNSLLGLHNFKYVDISFEESPNSTDTNRLLDARVRLLNSPRHRLSLSFELTNASNFSNKESNFFTSGNLGLGTTLGYQNNNLFGGAELLNIEGNLVFDLPKYVFTSTNRDFHNTFSSFEMGLNTSLDLPDFLMPFGQNIQWQSSKPHTLLELNSNYLYRNLTLPNYYDDGLNLDITLEQLRYGGSFGYTWSHNRNVKHKLLPINLSYSHLLSGSEYYIYLSNLISDIQFLYLAIDYVLLNTHYEYTYSNQKIGSRDNFNYLRFSVETAGNLLNAADRLIHSSQHTPDDNDLEYYQYFRFDSEFKRYIYWGSNNTLVLRSLMGFGIPYGHSYTIPYEKMFVGGGPTTMRGWALRHLGYGQFPTSQTDYTVGVGEIQFIANIEQRFPLVGIFEGAFFADMGNVWMCEDWGYGSLNQFQLSEILRGTALDAGIGIRANISVVTLRIDVALPLYDPGYPAGQRWLPSHWAWNTISTHFGINYPF